MRIRKPNIFKQASAGFLSFLLVLSMVSSAMPFFVSQVANASSPYVQDFSSNTADWTGVSSDGAGAAIATPGAFTKWGGYRDAFPVGGYSTQIDVYLDEADGTADKHFDFSSAINNQVGTHLRDFIFNVGTNPSTPNEWHVNVSNGSPGNPYGVGSVAVNDSGWYTLKQDFNRNSAGILTVAMSITSRTDSTVDAWTLSSGDDIDTAVGGNRYGWFVPAGTNMDVTIDNAQLILSDTVAATTYDFEVNHTGNFTQYQPSEFTVTTRTSDPGNDGSPMVRAYFTDDGGNGYYEYYDGATFQPFNGTAGFGPAGGFEYTEGATSTFRARYAQTGTYISHVEFRQVGTGTVIAAKDVTFTVAPSAQASTYSNGFETDTNSWNGINRVANGTSGVVSATGDYHAQVPENAYAYTNWGGYSEATPFPSGGYVTEQDVYLNMNEADGQSSKQFDFSSAINNTAGTHRRDFVATLGTNPSVANQWLVNAGNGTPGNLSAPGSAAITATGWYTIQHSFRDNGAGVLAVTVKLIRISDGALIFEEVLSDPSDLIGVTVGGNRYGWFVTNDFTNLAIDNTRKGPNPVATAPRPVVVVQPTYPGNGAGTVVTNGSISLLPSSANRRSYASSFASVFNTPSTNATDSEDEEILGSETTKKQSAKTSAVEATDNGWTIFGLAWYWWILLLAAIAAIWWFLARRRNAEQS